MDVDKARIVTIGIWGSGLDGGVAGGEGLDRGVAGGEGLDRGVAGGEGLDRGVTGGEGRGGGLLTLCYGHDSRHDEVLLVRVMRTVDVGERAHGRKTSART